MMIHCLHALIAEIERAATSTPASTVLLVSARGTGLVDGASWALKAANMGCAMFVTGSKPGGVGMARGAPVA